MLRLPKKSTTHEELFLERYPDLMSWAFQISRYDRNKAEDLVHDAYIQLTLVRPDLESIQNLDGYLYGMLRNMHSAELRRNFRAPTSPLSVVEYDSALLSLQRASDQVQTAHMQDQLRSVCAYACERKESSKAGSLLLLRFFHGYYPSETARIAGTRRVTVDSWLRIARAEAKLYLEDPQALKFITEGFKPAPAFWSMRNEWEFLDEIAQQISDSRRGECFSERKLRAIYSDSEPEVLDTEALAHIASCQACLIKAAKILNLPSRDDRNPPDCLGRDPKPGEKSKKARRGVAGSHNLRLQLEDMTEHRPNELQIAINGFTVGTQKVISERIEHSLNLSLQEQVGLIEVLSEQGIRLLCLYVESPPNGAIEQRACVQLSDDRTLGVVLAFREQWPTLELTYSDPHFAEVTSDPESIPNAEATVNKAKWSKSGPVSLFQSDFLMSAVRVTHHFWLRPAVVTAIVLLLMAIALFVVHRTSQVPVAAELLARAQTAERSTVLADTEVLHRSISFEERKANAAVVRGRVEFWRAKNGKTARRLYSNNGELLAGAWQADGTAAQNVFYNHGAKLKVSPLAQSRDHSVSTEHLWLLDPSAVTFSALVRGMSGRIESTGSQYIFTYRQPLERTGESDGAIIEAKLVVERESLHALSQSFVFDEGNGQQRSFDFKELSVERVPAAEIEEKIFQPDAELLTPIESSPSIPPATVSTLKPAVTEATHLPTVAELGALEVNILYLLDQINANSGEQIEVRRSPGRELLVEAIVDTDKRKAEILQALASMSNNYLVRMTVVTLAEALSRETGEKRAPQELDTVVVLSDRIPAYEEVRRYVERSSVTPGDVENEIRRFSGRMIDESRQSLLHVFALKHLVERFTPADLGSLNAESRAKWREMIRGHARGFRQSTAALRRDLNPVFPHMEAGQPTDNVDEINDDRELLEAVKSLVNFASATDDAISRAFSISPEAKPINNGPRNAMFWRTLSRAETLATAIEGMP
jgi:RNA polymerase sigma factor (sigma-70 family)